MTPTAPNTNPAGVPKALPQEILDKSVALAFSQKEPYTYIAADYRRPAALQISHNIRSEFARVYYRGIFVGECIAIYHWLESLGISGRKALKDVRCWIGGPSGRFPGGKHLRVPRTFRPIYRAGAGEDIMINEFWMLLGPSTSRWLTAGKRRSVNRL